MGINVSRHSEGQFKKELVDYADADLFALGSTLTWVDGLLTLTNHDDEFKKAFNFIKNLGCDVSVEADHPSINDRVGFVHHEDGRLALLYAIHDNGADVVYAVAYLDADDNEPYVYVPRNGNNLNQRLGTINGREADNIDAVGKMITAVTNGNADGADERLNAVADDLNKMIDDERKKVVVDVDVMLAEFWAKTESVDVAIDGGVAAVGSDDFKRFFKDLCPDGDEQWTHGVAELLRGGEAFANVHDVLHGVGSQIDDGDVYLIDGHAVAVVYPFDVNVKRVALVVYLDESMNPRAYVPLDGNVFNKDTMTPYGSEYSNPGYTGGSKYENADVPDASVGVMLNEFADKLLPNRSKTCSADHFGVAEVSEPKLVENDVEAPSLWHVRMFVKDGVECDQTLVDPAYIVIAKRADGERPARFAGVVALNNGDVGHAWRLGNEAFNEALPVDGVDTVLVIDRETSVEYVLLDGEPRSVSADDASVDQRVLAKFKAARNLDDRPVHVVFVNA